MEDSSKLEYQAGQEEEAGGSKDKPEPQKEQKKEQQPQDGEAPNDKGEEGGEEGGVNEDFQEKYEDSHFAPPTAPEQVRTWVIALFMCSFVLLCNFGACQSFCCNSKKVVVVWLGFLGSEADPYSSGCSRASNPFIFTVSTWFAHHGEVTTVSYLSFAFY